MLRYALLRHECPDDYRDGPHWDLMLERPDVPYEHRLATWSLLDLPLSWSRCLGISFHDPTDQTNGVTTEELPDHRAMYLDYEGPISANRGSVARAAGGTLEWVESMADTVSVQLDRESALPFAIRIKRIRGSLWRLTTDEAIASR
ncbi:MAG: hypothetical protein AAF266_00105 [Planctomycetota bacterium]